MACVILPALFYKYTSNVEKVEIEGITVQDVIANLINVYPDVARYFFNVDGSLASHINYYVNNNDIKHLNGVSTPVSNSDIVMILPAIAGG